MRHATLSSAGRKVSSIPVMLSYHIIEHFSRGLYSSPFKAIEELVANSYDAGAGAVGVIVPENTRTVESRIWVIDDGFGMDEQGLKDLWLIGRSHKRDTKPGKGQRLPIGKFGIGKLATYVLAKELTYVTKAAGKFLSVTMDFGVVESKHDETVVSLDLRSLTEGNAKEVLSDLIVRKDRASKRLTLFGPQAPVTWTVAVMSKLTELAQDLTLGRLRWILSTALPLNPDFCLFLNGDKVSASRETRPKLGSWVIGKNDGAAKELRFETVKRANEHMVVVPQLGEIHGEIELYEDALTGGKAEKWARSNGFFVLVRERLLNIQDPLFGLEPLSHGAFSRFRMVVHADGLDSHLRSTRETVLDSAPGVMNFRNYLKAKFNEVRGYYNDCITRKDTGESVATKASRAPKTLSREPLIRTIRKYLEGAIGGLTLIKVPRGLDKEQSDRLLAALESEVVEESEFFKDVNLVPSGIDMPLAVFNVENRTIEINILHPYFANYQEHYTNYEPFELLAVAEILTEAYLVDEDLPLEMVSRILSRRDRLLRELVYSKQLSAVLVAQMLRENKADANGLEDAVYSGIRSLGFEVVKLGRRKGGPDGIAKAPRGVEDDRSGRRGDFSLNYDAKSTGAKRVSAKTVGASAISRHRRQCKADYSLVVAPGFQGEASDKSAVVTEARQENITLVTVDDFVLLVLIASSRPLGFGRLRELLETCRSPLESRLWIQGLLKEQVPAGPLPDILGTVWEMQKESPDRVNLAAVAERMRLELKKDHAGIRQSEIREWLTSVQRFCPDLVYIERDFVSLEQPPGRILREVRSNVSRLPEALRATSMYQNLLENATD